jgi:hypothetical protein
MVRRLRYVIMDEVHNITGENGPRWERVMHGVECPFIALSASIGSPELFGRWAQGIASRTGRDLVTIPAPDIPAVPRYNALEHWTWAGARMQPLGSSHLIVVDAVRASGFVPPRITLTPEESLELFQLLRVSADTSTSAELCAAFANAIDTAKVDNPVLAQLVGAAESINTMPSADHATKLERLVLVLVAIAARYDPDALRVTLSKAHGGAPRDMRTLKDDDLVAATVDCLSSLGWAENLPLTPGFPAIVFRDSADQCEAIAMQLCDHLETSQCQTLAVEFAREVSAGDLASKSAPIRNAVAELKKAGLLRDGAAITSDAAVWDTEVYDNGARHGSPTITGTVLEVLTLAREREMVRTSRSWTVAFHSTKNRNPSRSWSLQRLAA